MQQQMTVNGSSEVLKTHERVHVHLDGAFDGASVTVEFQDYATAAWVPLTGAVYTTAIDDIIQLGRSGYQLRATVASAGASTDLRVMLL